MTAPNRVDIGHVLEAMELLLKRGGTEGALLLHAALNGSELGACLALRASDVVVVRPWGIRTIADIRAAGYIIDRKIDEIRRSSAKDYWYSTVIHAHLSRQGAIHQFLNGYVDLSGALFASQKGGTLGTRAAARLLQEQQQDAGVKRPVTFRIARQIGRDILAGESILALPPGNRTSRREALAWEARDFLRFRVRQCDLNDALSDAWIWLHQRPDHHIPADPDTASRFVRICAREIAEDYRLQQPTDHKTGWNVDKLVERMASSPLEDGNANEREVTRERMTRALDVLTPVERAVVTLRYGLSHGEDGQRGELTYEEISTELKRPIGAVAQALGRASEKLRRHGDYLLAPVRGPDRPEL